MRTNAPFALLTASLAWLAGPAASGAVVIDSIDDSSGFSQVDLNVDVDGTGGVSTGSPWFALSGNISQSGAYGGTIGVTFDAGKNMSTGGATIGDELADGNINRDINGFMGVGGAPNAGGIGADATNHEGITISFDELTNIPPTVGIRITDINIQNVGRDGDPTDESFTIVNLLTRDSLTFNPVPDNQTAGNFDVTGLNLEMAGGDSGALGSIYSGDTGGFRIDGFTFETYAVPEPSIALLGLLGLSGLLRRRR